MQTSGERRAGRWVDVPLPFRTAIHTSPPHTHTHTTLQEIAPAVTAKFDWLDPKPANAINCPPGYFSANTTGPCEVCGVGYWCPGGFQSTPRRVQVKNALWRWEERQRRQRCADTTAGADPSMSPRCPVPAFVLPRTHSVFFHLLRCIRGRHPSGGWSTSSTWACHLPS
jgi:hypothetical protein